MSKLPLVKEIMATKLVRLSPDMNIEEAIGLLLKHRISGAPVVDAESKLVGILSEKDCLRIFANGAYNNLPGGVVGQYMSKTLTTIDANADLFSVADIFFQNTFRRLPVLDDEGHLLGQVSRRDVLEGSRQIWETSPVEAAWTDAKYLTDEIKAALESPHPRPETD
jgi:CBS domain-containing protein